MQTPSLRARLTGQVGTLHIDVELSTEGGPLVLAGPNGAGKTSVLLMLLGAIRPQAARIEVGGVLLHDSAAGMDLPIELRRLGYVPQHYALFPHMTVRQNIAFALAGDKRQLAARLDAVLSEHELGALADRHAGVLSGGEKQRVALARALSAAPRALLLDEPLAALDIGTRRAVRASLAGYLATLSLPTIIVTHDAADARALGHRIAVLEAGKLVQLGTFDELAAKPASVFVEELVALAPR